MTQGVFEVVVRGAIGRDLAFALHDFEIRTDPDGLTRVVGPVSDQSQLLSMLEAFDDLHLEVVSVNPSADSSSEDDVGPLRRQ